MRRLRIAQVLLLLALVYKGLSAEGQVRRTVDFAVTEFTDEAYPDNPDIGFRASDYQASFFERGQLICRDNSQHELLFVSRNGDSIYLQGLDLHSWVPAAPSSLRADEYLFMLSLVNQEWNRNQVRFDKGSFWSNNKSIVRVDVARNCLNAYLWEVAVYTEEQGTPMPYAHAWFDFPAAEYDRMFLENNAVTMDAYRHCLVDWADPPSKPVNEQLLRRSRHELVTTCQDVSQFPYALAGERSKKRKEIIWPAEFTTMRDLQSDSTTFATFSPPGNYRRDDPRKTELGRIHRLEAVRVFRTSSDQRAEGLFEIEMTFLDQKKERTTRLVLGGLDFESLPILSESDAHLGWQNSMGFGNHTFYESIERHETWEAAESPYYAYLADGSGNWLDSHAIGIDGPLMHWDIDNPDVLHIWLLSFERHALVGHYLVKLH